MNEQTQCFVCKRNDAVIEPDLETPLSPKYMVKCKTCGDYEISCDYNGNRQDSFILSGVLRRLYSYGKQPYIDSQFLKDFEGGFYNHHIPVTVHDKAMFLLEYIELKSIKPSQVVEIIGKDDVSLVFGSTKEEIDYFITYLKDTKLIALTPPGNGSANGCIITVKGWQYLDDRKNTSINSKQCFVAMCFSDEYKDVLENSIEPAINEAGFAPLLINKLAEMNATSEDHVDDLIISEIRKSRFMVADFSEVRPNVCFEAGFAKGLGIPVIYCVKKEFADKKQLPFDTEHYYHLLWEDGKYDEFKKALKQKIQAEIYS